jgi:hypothetical protein
MNDLTQRDIEILKNLIAHHGKDERALSLRVGREGDEIYLPQDRGPVLRGNSRVMKEIIINAGESAAASITPPTRAFRAVGASGTVVVDVYQFSAADEMDVFFEFHLPTDFDLSAPAYLHIMWAAGTGYTTGNFRMCMEWLVAHEEALILAGTPTTQILTIAPTAGYWREDEFGPVYFTNPESKVMCHFYRDAANVLDTANGTADVDFFELEYVANRLGAVPGES